MDYPILYSKFETEFTHYGLAVLENVYEFTITQRMNSDYVCSFFIPRTDEKYQYISEENIIKANGQLFQIRKITDSRTENNQLLAFVECEHLSYELISNFIESIDLTNESTNSILSAILSGSRFTGNGLSVSGTFDFAIDKKNSSAALNQLLETVDGEIQRDNFNITIKPQIGSDNGVQFRYKKNIKNIERRLTSEGVVTRLFVYGKDDLTIDAVNNEKKYLDSANINVYPVPKTGFIKFNEIIDANELKAAGQEYLLTVDTPLVSYNISVIELKKAVGYDESEGFTLGDTVRIADEDLNLNLTARIMEYTEFPIEPERSTCVLANFFPSLIDTTAQLEDSQRAFQNITYKGKLNTYWLDGKINALKNQLLASGSYATAQVIEGQGTLFENTNQSSPDYGALYIGPGIFAIANSKLGNGQWNWRTFGTGKGFTADEIDAGQIRTSLVKIFGDVNFFWDDRYIMIQNPSIPQQQIRIGLYDGTHYGIGFTTNSGASWSSALDFNGLTIGVNTNFQNGYDPSTKETPAGAQSKASAAQSAAVSTSSTDASNKANAAELNAKSYAENIAVLKNVLYNGIVINTTDGFKSTRSDNKVRTLMNSTGGIVIQKSTDNGATWTDVFYVDTDGNLISKGYINLSHSNGSKTVIDGASYRIYPDGNVSTNYIGVDSDGLFRNFNGTISRFIEAFTVGNGFVPGGSVSSFGSNLAPSFTSYDIQTISLTGAQWMNKASRAKAQLNMTNMGSSQDTTLNQQYFVMEVQSITNTANGIDISVKVGASFYRFDGFSNGVYNWTYQDVDFNYSYIVIA